MTKKFLNKQAKLLSVLAKVAPGTDLRHGINHIVSARTGALIVIGDTTHVMGIINGGFELNCDFIPQKLYELAKMDGAIILDEEVKKILLANVHLVPDPSLPTSETGMRHRTAERVARQTKALVISISQKRDTVSLYLDDIKYALQDITVVLSKANQAMQTLEKYKSRLDQVSENLSALEFEDLVVLVDALTVIQRAEMVKRVAAEIRHYITELGTDGRLINMQLEELVGSVSQDTLMVLKDYLPDYLEVKEAQDQLKKLTADELLELDNIARAIGFQSSVNLLDKSVHPRGYRLLSHIPRLPNKVIAKIVERFGSLQAVIHASVGALDEVEGVGEVRARAIQDGLRRLKEHNLLERYS